MRTFGLGACLFLAAVTSVSAQEVGPMLGAANAAASGLDAAGLSQRLDERALDLGLPAVGPVILAGDGGEGGENLAGTGLAGVGLAGVGLAGTGLGEIGGLDGHGRSPWEETMEPGPAGGV